MGGMIKLKNKRKSEDSFNVIIMLANGEQIWMRLGNPKSRISWLEVFINSIQYYENENNDDNDEYSKPLSSLSAASFSFSFKSSSVTGLMNAKPPDKNNNSIFRYFLSKVTGNKMRIKMNNDARIATSSGGGSEG